MRRRSSGGYVYPLPPGEWTTSRTDQGVDFVNKSAGSRILAIGRGKILSTGAPGWPGGGGVLYELLDGPRKGQVVYAYENVSPHVRTGQIVQAGQTIATMKGTGYPWLEMGFADRSGVPTSHGEYSEGDETRAGKAFKAFIGGLGVGRGSNAPTAAELAKHKRIAGEEGGKLGSDLPGEGAFEKNIGQPGNEAIEAGADAVKGGIDLTKAVIGALENPETLLLNVALVGGGSFLVYYGAALMLGVRKPVAAPVKAVSAV